MRVAPRPTRRLSVRLLALACGACALAVAGCTDYEPNVIDTTGTLRIVAVDSTAAPLPGVTTRTQPGNIRDTTDAAGIAVVDPIEEGTYVLFATFGSREQRGQFTIAAGATTETVVVFGR